MQHLAAGAHGPSPAIDVVFAVGGVVALWCGLSWAFDVRGITTRRVERMRRRSEEASMAMGRLGGAPTFFATSGYVRFLGSVMAGAGLLMLTAAYALWHLN
ncbi:hypothetical protein ACGFT2_01250 [Streptomyces sp. NPDC048514]|uniref:hypothetical protein n=1 Tax=Streptomyces sp. NPDC048514 TaxID=3365564 RepID=UPI003720A8D9